ncbi:circadian clock KaiB family protein [Variovorax humicola]|uniref:Circadian clock KaiB family protein n=1 Tax=Variovorax humicola TaxID=1769758 RepID=A0ABU8W0V0_9BURK
MTTEATPVPQDNYLTRASDVQTFRLYVSGMSPISLRAISNARRFLEEALPGRHRLSVMNIVEHVQTACADQVVASPTLLRVSPLPQRRFIGDLSDTARLRRSLGLPALMGG